MSGGEQVRSIRIFGTTWAQRGWRYWIRRVGITVLWTGVAALEIGIIVAFWSGLVEAAGNSIATVAISTVLTGLLLGGLVWAIRGWREVREAERSGDIARLHEIVDKESATGVKPRPAQRCSAVADCWGFRLRSWRSRSGRSR